MKVTHSVLLAVFNLSSKLLSIRDLHDLSHQLAIRYDLIRSK